MLELLKLLNVYKNTDQDLMIIKNAINKVHDTESAKIILYNLGVKNPSESQCNSLMTAINNNGIDGIFNLNNV